MIFISMGKGGWIPGSLIIGVGLWSCLFLVTPEPPGWSFTLMLIVAGLFCIGLGMHARFSPARLVRNPTTGCERFKRPTHSAYWIRAEYWGLLYLGLATWMQSAIHLSGAK